MENTPTKEDLILSEVQCIRAELIVIREHQLQHGKDIAGLKVKAGLWSAFVSAVVAFLGLSWKG